VSGILFRPSVHYETGAGARPAERLRDLRKDQLYRLMLRHTAVRCVHTLDDAFPACARARYRNGTKVTVLPDPAFPRIQPTAAERALAERAPGGRTLLVLFGVLTERKGILALLRALAILDAATAGRLAVVLAGEVEPRIRAEVDAAIAAMATAQPSLWLHLEPRHLRAGEIAALVDRADAVLAPYQRFVGSSGVLMWAAGRGRPVIAQDYGLVGRLVREHGLGLAVDTSDAAELARAIAVAAGGGAHALAEPGRLAAFAANRTPDAFAAGLLDPILRGAAPGHEGVRREQAAVPAGGRIW
jgi:glycosyltransferase involved in cell wall biosynthesis